ncbi:MAG: hypothetical protein OXC54_08105, partial [Rhodospirillaceae bacterium]|nr:hypothetical protein [Rhodospirillaceae bacterium]
HPKRLQDLSRQLRRVRTRRGLNQRPPVRGLLSRDAVPGYLVNSILMGSESFQARLVRTRFTAVR